VLDYPAPTFWQPGKAHRLDRRVRPSLSCACDDRRIAQAEFDKHRPQAVVGSSRRQAVAMNINGGNARLVLLCPAWKKHGSTRTVKPGAVILHARADDVVPFADSEELVRNSRLPASALIEVGDDHRLADPEPLRKILEACSGAPAALNPGVEPAGPAYLHVGYDSGYGRGPEP
jgi:hypothetical protein